ncbi:hypothetical protein BDQ12DRAFT_111542 [Crucibulum laeve]|uniref:ER-bound oxygenase mpaB/mpaB'/Rubber oxygenase catalytic domain-containing protein n=1 Tax=Crucibulum laeve TaxID=68775 RepID=A0A5C3LZ91_9AGAR|nr:hypothetical protein BDQ12DRAFT_111542 [Crucibulum laeve]
MPFCFASQLPYFFDFKVNLNPTAVACAIPVVSYLCLVRALRWRRYNAIHRKYQAKFMSGTLTPEDAQEIILVSCAYDMPFLLNYALAFALFKTYGIPTISKLLCATKELGSKDNVSKRYADTEILISTWVGCPLSGIKFDMQNKPDVKGSGVTDPRAMIALARVNWLHSRYNISNDDYLYTLILFALEPPTWAENYGWRACSPMEKHAYYVFWAEIGRKMGIKNIPESAEAMKEWSTEYERTHMVPAQSNKEVAKHTTDELLATVPESLGLKHFAEGITVCLLDETVRIAMMQPTQPWYKHVIVRSTLLTFAFVERWFLLPRKKAKLPGAVDEPKDMSGPCPRLYPSKFQVKPWYKPASTGVWYYVNQILVKIGWHNEMPGPHLRSGGYRVEELGPVRLENTGHEEVMRMAAELQGCPITGPWSLEGRQ